ncbi:4-hydroxybutyrate CoA-transferase (plasmid) [Paraburkholderia sp. PGU19]|uniref:acetyl-CoA hydrolase/transferase family protein n=1 Tax=Paraburkholderia sp. PGU19 TaxID=2735434 RepID=UPI0015DA0B2B|nr:acetyl-CoA hydrolase/transferase C-terminal domain-containing protein [Paraburkholderia sp. PGU19]BCG04914.1 4-hydroxybutyrate CoA-transferase [Paraburkholderia sp. PGU19]
MAEYIAEAELAQLVKPHDHIFIPGSSGEPSAFMSALLRERNCTQHLRILTSYVPGINKLAIDRFEPTASVSGLFMQPGLHDAQRDGRYRFLPVTYAGFVRHLRENVELDLTVVQVSPPDDQGLCSLGPAVEFAPTAIGKSRRILALVNRRTPRVRGAASIPYSRFDYVCEVDSALPQYVTALDDSSISVARHVASLIDDGSTVQVGLGRVPAALSLQLKERRKLRFHSGMLSDGFTDLVAAGAIDESAIHTCCVLVGSESLYRWAAEFEALRVVGCDLTHNVQTLAGKDRFISVNSALEVDLFGQCNLEHADGRSISGPGGAPDFARGARLSNGGRSIVALSATHSAGKGSRVVPRLSERSIGTLSRVDVDYIVTEFGVARLVGASVHERAKVLIDIAAPEFREGLSRSWREIAACL